MEAAFQEIASVGFEGLRVRTVAQAAGIHHATLLHHFPSKESLVQAVLDTLEAQFRPQGDVREMQADPLTQLREEFDDGLRRLAENPETFAVLLEITLRARHHAGVKEMIGRMYHGWQAHITQIFALGCRRGVFRSDLDPNLAAGAVMLSLKGSALELLSGCSLERLGAMLGVVSQQVIAWSLPG